MKSLRFFFNADAGGVSGGGAAAASGGGSTSSGAATTTLLGSAGDGAASSSSSQQQGSASASQSFAWAGEDGKLSDGWLDRLGDGLKDNPSLRSIGTLQDLAKSYVETKGMIGKKLEAPGAEATPEQIAAWRKTVGAPEKPEGYYGDAKTLRPESVPEAYWDAAGEKKFLEVAHKHHLPPAAVKDILALHGQNVADALKGSQAKETEILATETGKLRDAWKGEFDANIALASRVAQTVGLDPKTHPIFQSAEVVQAFAKLGKLFKEDSLVKGDTATMNGSIVERIRDITDPKSTSQIAREYRNEFGPQRQAEAQRIYHGLLEAQAKQH